LQALLNAAGIEAWPALVNSFSGKMIQNSGISPLAFNHAIVKAKVDDQIYWLDPTLPLVKNKEADLTPPRYEKALVLATGENALTDIPLAEKDPNSYHIAVTDYYSLPDGVYGKMNWKRETTFSGASADYIRTSIDYIGTRQLGINLRETQQKIYENIENNEFTTVKDDGKFYTILEDYKVDKAGTYNQNRNYTEFKYAPLNIVELLSTPSSVSDRKSPFALSYPARRQSRVTIDAIGAAFKPFINKISNAYFTYGSSGKYLNNGDFQMKYEFETHQDHVPLEDLKEYTEDINRINAELFFYIVSQGETKNSVLEVYQPVHNPTRQVVNKDSRDVYEKINMYINTDGLRYIEESREEILDILNDDALTTEASDEFFQMLIGFSVETSKTEEALFYHDLHVNGNGKIPMQLILSLTQHLVKELQYANAVEVLEKEIDDMSAPKDSMAAEILQSNLRQIYWITRDFEKLAEVLMHLTETFPQREFYFRELGVIYGLLNRPDNARAIRTKMAELDYSDVEIKIPAADDERKRIPRPLIRFSPIYPQKAQRIGIEGYALASFTVKENGAVENCRVVESSPQYFFESAACDAVSKFYYYPVEAVEEKGDVHNIRNRIEFTLAN
ncbi:MAG: energy transducer TonB, partial [SAR324 cluster bacterium]|nr:energy transducer TonB [SAR324 cluster bacterium]